MVRRFYKINETNFSITPELITINSGESFPFEINGNNFSYAFESPSGDSCVAPCLETELSPTQDGTYTFLITDSESGCQGRYEIEVKLFFSSSIGIPTAFTPNGDGINDLYRLYGKDIQQINFKIYSRWGELLFEGNSTNDFWDGSFKSKPLASGIFLLNIEGSGKDGQRYEKTQKIKLIR